MAQHTLSMMKKLLTKPPASSASSLLRISHRSFASKNSSSFPEPEPEPEEKFGEHGEDDVVPTSGISRPLSEILKQLNKKVPDSLVKLRVEDGFSIKYIPWFVFCL